METSFVTQEEKLRQEILHDASLKAERVIARAKNDAEKLLAQTQKDADARREKALEEARAGVESECASLRQNVTRKIRAAWLQHREELLEEFLREQLAACKALTGAERETSYAALVQEALAALAETDYRVYFPKECDFITADWLRKQAKCAIGEQAEITFELHPEGKPGIRLETTDGHLSFDNSYDSRLTYLKEQLRTLVVD